MPSRTRKHRRSLNTPRDTSRFRPLVEELEDRLVLSPPGPGWQQIFADEFNGTSLNPAVWSIATGPRRNAVNTASAVSVGGGNLTITTYTQSGTHYTGFIGSHGGYLSTFGYWEARIKFQGSPGMWSAFWLQSPTMGNPIGNPAVAGTEIDIVEHRARDAAGADISNRAVSNIHWDGYGPSHRSVGSGLVTNPGATPLQGNFHTYGLLWTPTGYQFYIDGILRWSTTQAVSHRSEFIYLTSEVQNSSWAGTIPAGGYGSLAASTTKMMVDWVRVHRRPPTISPITDLAVNENTPTPAVPFTVTNPESLTYTLTPSSSNTNLVPAANVQFGGSGASRTVTVTPLPGRTGTATITLTAATSDGRASSSEAFTVTVNAGSFQNSGFELNPLGVGWARTGSAQVVSFNQRSGSRALRADGPSGAAEQLITGLAPGTTYTLGGWLRVSHGAATAQIGVKDYGGPDVSASTSNTAYTYRSVVFTTGPASTQATVYVRKPTAGHAAEFDDLLLFRAPTLIAHAGTFRNIGFEENPAGVGWSRSGSAQVVNFNQRSGSRALRMNGPAGYAEQVITDLEPNTTYTVGGWLRVSSGAATAQIGVKNYGGPDGSASTSNTAYTYRSVVFTTGPDSTEATVYVRKPTGSHAADFDDLDLFLEPPGARLPNRTTDEDTPISIRLRVGNVGSAAGSWSVTAASSNTTLVPNGNLAVSGSGLDRALTITPAANQWGSTTVTVTVSDIHGGSVARGFVLTVNPVNDAPALAPLADQTIPASQDVLTVPLSASDAEGDALTFSAVAQSLAYVLDQQLGLYFTGDYYENYGGLGERWMLGSGEQWYFILPNGELYRAEDGALVGNVGASYWADPSLLHDAQPDQPHATLSFSENTLIIDREDGFVGGLVIWVTVSDGTLTDTRMFTVTVNG